MTVRFTIGHVGGGTKQVDVPSDAVAAHLVSLLEELYDSDDEHHQVYVVNATDAAITIFDGGLMAWNANVGSESASRYHRPVTQNEAVEILSAFVHQRHDVYVPRFGPEVPPLAPGLNFLLVGMGEFALHLKAVAGLKDLQTLKLFGAGVTDAGLKELAELKQLQELDLSDTKVTDAGLKELVGLKRLRSLSLRSVPVKDTGLKNLVILDNLEELGLTGSMVTDTGLKQLVGLKRLHTLYLAFTQVTDTGLKELAALKQLQVLSLYRVERITEQGVRELRKALPKCDIRRE